MNSQVNKKYKVNKRIRSINIKKGLLLKININIC